MEAPRGADEAGSHRSSRPDDASDRTLAGDSSPDCSRRCREPTADSSASPTTRGVGTKASSSSSPPIDQLGAATDKALDLRRINVPKAPPRPSSPSTSVSRAPSRSVGGEGGADGEARSPRSSPKPPSCLLPPPPLSLLLLLLLLLLLVHELASLPLTESRSSSSSSRAPRLLDFGFFFLRRLRSCFLRAPSPACLRRSRPRRRPARPWR